MKRDKTIYVVSEGMEGGYLPESVSYFWTKAEATDYMRERAADARFDGYKVSGSARNGWYVLNDGRALDQYINLDTVSAADCAVTSRDDLTMLNS